MLVVHGAFSHHQEHDYLNQRLIQPTLPHAIKGLVPPSEHKQRSTMSYLQHPFRKVGQVMSEASFSHHICI